MLPAAFKINNNKIGEEPEKYLGLITGKGEITGNVL
jgi:hypothetical protein